MKKICLAATLSVAAVSFWACGDDVTEIYENSGAAILESGKKLSKQDCDSTNVGEYLFVTDSSAMYLCNGKTWQPLKGKDGESKKGEAGENGSSCSAKKVTKDKRTGYELTCGKDVVDTIWNGVEGTKGADGGNGADCKVASDKGGVITLSCGDVKTELYKAVCGEDPYDPAEKFCYEGTLEDLCDGEAYNLSNEICKDGKVVPTCGGETYDVSKQFCFEGGLVDLCGVKAYNPSEQFCDDGVVAPYCNGKTYDTSVEFCYKGNTYYLCGGFYSYNVEKQYCQDSEYPEDYGSFKDNRDQKTYRTVVIGTQTWMAENLNFNSNFLPENATDSVYNSTCGGGNDSLEISSDCDKYGRLYLWSAAIDSVTLAQDATNPMECGFGSSSCTLPERVRGICPEGWHLPSAGELETLISFVKSNGNLLKTSYGWEKLDDETGVGTDSYGFSALPAGGVNVKGENVNGGLTANFWISTMSTLVENNAYSMRLAAGSEKITYGATPMNLKKSIRCIQDAAN